MKKIKCTTEDYTESDLPATRKEVFKDCFKEQLPLIFRLGLLCLAFLVPVIITMFVRDAYIITAVEGLEEKTAERISAIYYTADTVFGIVQVVFVTLFAVLFAGIVRILRQMIWYEPIFFGDDFKNGIKGSAAGFSVTTFILAIINYLLNLLPNSTFVYIMYAIFVALIAPVAVWYALYGIYYKLGVFASIKNAILLYLNTVPVTLLLLVLTVLPFWAVVKFITVPIAKYAVFIVLAAFYVIPLTMSWLLYACQTFDKYINKENYPDIYRKGMKKENDEENQSQDMRSLY